MKTNDPQSRQRCIPTIVIIQGHNLQQCEWRELSAFFLHQSKLKGFTRPGKRLLSYRNMICTKINFTEQKRVNPDGSPRIGKILLNQSHL